MTGPGEKLAHIAEHAEAVARAEREKQRNNMSVALDMDALYRDTDVWVDEWLGQKPEPKRPTNRWNPADRNRYISWLAWTLGNRGAHTLSRPYSWQLLEGAAIARIVPATNLATVGPVRPLFWLRKYGYDNRLPEVWALAMDLADGDPSRLTETITRDALTAWKRGKFGNRMDGKPRTSAAAINAAATAQAKAHAIRVRMLEEIAELHRLASRDRDAWAEFTGLLTDLDTFLDAHEKGAA